MSNPRGDFLTLAAHDLKEPLRSIEAFSKLLADDYGNRLDAKAQFYLEHMQTAAARLRAMIESLLIWGRIETSAGSRQICDPAKIVAEFREELTGLFPIGNIRINGTLPAVRAEPQLLYRLFVNLLQNGLKFNRSSFPTVTVSGEPGLEMATFAFRDNGIGIDAGDHARMFQPWQRLHSQDEYEGSGLGLAICRRIVESHGGRIWLSSSTPGEGSVFAFTLPSGAVNPGG
jgi:signal transduction histidine kinase